MENKDAKYIDCSFELNITALLALSVLLFIAYVLGSDYFYSSISGGMVALIALIVYMLLTQLELAKTEKTFSNKLKEYSAAPDYTIKYN